MASTNMPMFNKEKLIIHTCFVEVKKVDAASYLSILLFYRQDVLKPGRVLYGLYKTSIQKFLYLLFDLYLELWPEVSRPLFHWLGSFLYFKPMHKRLRVDPWYLGIGTCKDIYKFLQESKKCLPQLGWQASTYENGLCFLSLSGKVYLDQLLALVFRFVLFRLLKIGVTVISVSLLTCKTQCYGAQGLKKNLTFQNIVRVGRSPISQVNFSKEIIPSPVPSC